MKQKPSKKVPVRRESDGAELSIKIAPFGLTAERAASLAQTITKHRAVQKFLAGTRNRLLTLDLLDPPISTSSRTASRSTAPMWWCGTVRTLRTTSATSPRASTAIASART
jgi:hypothetical protein